MTDGANIEPRLTKRALSLAILGAVKRAGRTVHRSNLLGTGYSRGDLAHYLDRTTLSDEERQDAYTCFEDLLRMRLLTQPRMDISAPDDWVMVSPAGVAALERGAVDDLDTALLKLDPRFLEMREGMWVAALSANPDRARQAAQSARELIDQVLKDHGKGETRRLRARSLMTKIRGSRSEKDEAIAENAIDLLLSVADKLISESHSRKNVMARDISDLLQTAEIALRRLLS